ncbi:DUF6461 domain-containing protein [Actinoplanes utahensis]|uniref:DUF6461 domain-containing protein n=1 Tax=Actinoplanes utahensis TaxID=1869 RepID=UPI000ACABA50|nr:DUF6461 domain-containing protein [Actinoplanes utahensis]
MESYRLTMWAAPEAPETVLKRTDRLGHRLRGEPEPNLPPEHAYRWVQNSSLSVAATVTVVTGSTARQVLPAFGADPDLPEQAQVIAREQALRRTYEQWVTILETGDAILVVEDNGYRGADPEVLQAASAGGRAASMFWNVNALTRLSFAEFGRLLASHEPFGSEIWPPVVTPAVAGLDFGKGEPGDRIGKGLVAVERFTGRGLTPADLTAVKQTGLGYRIRGN